MPNRAQKKNQVVAAKKGPPKAYSQKAASQIDITHRALVQMVDPTHGVEPLVFPAPVPSLAGAARYPLTVEFDGSSTTGWGIVIKPSVSEPILVTHTAPVPESDAPFIIEHLIENQDTANLEAKYRGYALLPEHIQSDNAFKGGVRMALPMVSSSGSSFTWEAVRTKGNLDTVRVNLCWFNANTGQTGVIHQHTLTAFGGTQSESGLAWSSSYTHYFFEVSGGSGEIVLGHCLLPQANGNFTVPNTQNVMSSILPSWQSLLSVATRYRVVAMDCLLTYTGSTLKNSGVVAVANVDSSLAAEQGPDGCSFYNALTRRPYDQYNGRLASEGSTEGGAHWYYCPDDVTSLSMHSTDPDRLFDMPAGVFGVEGMDVEGKFKLTINVTLNFYSEDPQHVMKIQPGLGPFNVGLAALRQHVPLVSSNDSHLKKVAKTLKSGIRSAGGILSDGLTRGLNELKEHPELITQAALMLI